MRIEKVQLRDIGPFVEEVTIPFPEGSDPNLADVYLLAGPNGCGKSTVLYAIADAASSRAPAKPLAERYRSQAAMAKVTFQSGENTTAVEFSAHGTQSNVGILYAERSAWAAFAYEGQRSLGSGELRSVEDPAGHPLNGALSFASNRDNLARWIVSNEFRRLKAKDAGKEDKSQRFAHTRERIESLIRDITGDETFAFVTNEDDNHVRIRQHGQVLAMHVLPDGLASIVSWVADLLMRLDRLPWVDETPPEQRPFLLLLDEIDIHLHPAWQRKVLPMAQRMFPKAQIIASTHSPFVVGSAADAHIISFKVEQGVSTVDQVVSSQQGSSYGAILRSLFGIAHEFDLDTERLFAELQGAKARLLQGDEGAKPAFEAAAEKLEQRGEEVVQLVALERRQLARQLAVAGKP